MFSPMVAIAWVISSVTVRPVPGTSMDWRRSASPFASGARSAILRTSA